MLKSPSSQALATTLIALGLAGCGGGGGSSSDGSATPPPTGTAPPTTTTVQSEGVVTGFGSVYVNGVRHEVDDDTSVNVDDDDVRTGDDGALRLGMKVNIIARESDDGRRIANSIEHRRDLKGPVTAVVVDADDMGLGSFQLARTSVLVNGETVFDANVGDNDGNGTIDIRDLTVTSGRMVVEVSGFAADDGYLATRISRRSGNDDDDDDIEIKGFIDSVDTTASTLTVSGTTFTVTGATQFDEGLDFDASLVGAFVEVEGRQTTSGYEAIEVEREDDDDRDGQFEIEGILISVDTTVTPNLIQVGGSTIPVTDASALSGLIGAKVEIKGSFNSAGVLVIGESRNDNEDNLRTEDIVATVDAAAGTFTTRLGLVIRPEGTSRLEDDDDDDDRLTPAAFLNRLRAGDQIEARGFLTTGDAVSWTRIERESDDDGDQECELRGPVESIAGDQESFQILGVTIDVASTRSVEFEDESDDDISRAGFFDRLRVGTLVDAESDDDGNACQDGLLLAEEVEIEREEQAPFAPPADNGSSTGGVVFLLIDEDSIDNGNAPNDFAETDVNDQLADIGLRTALPVFQNNPGTSLDLFSGSVGDEGWFALKTIPTSWRSAGPTGNGTTNYLQAGPGLGAPGDDREVLLDQIPDVTPLRATGLAMLAGRTVCAVVYDSDVGINYSPLTGNLQGATLGIVGLDVVTVTERTDGSTSDLPRVGIRTRDAAVCDGALSLFANAPVPASSSEPFDVAPPANPPALQLAPAP